MIKIGIIGCGKISEVRHAPEYFENTNCQLVAYYDETLERAQALAEQYGGKVCSSINEVLEMSDAVSVCVANAAHADITVRALESGVHVLCEKPMATTLQGCESMVDAAKRADKFLMLGHNQRFAKAHVKARKLIENGEIGKVLTFRTTFGHPGPEGWTGDNNSWFFDKKKAHFGAMADLGVHKTDLIHYLLNDVIVGVEATLGTCHKTYPDGTPIDVDDNALCIYKMKSGAIGTMHVSWTFYGDEDNATVIYGTDGVVRCYDDPKYSLIVEKKNGERHYYALDKMTSNEEQTTGGRISTGVIDAFIDSLVTSMPPAVSGEEAIKAMRVIFAAEQAAHKGCSVTVTHN